MQSNEVLILMPDDARPGDFERIADAAKVIGFNAVSEKTAFRKHVWRGVAAIKARLTEQQFKVFEGVVLDGQTRESVARALGSNVTAVARLMTAIRRNLGMRTNEQMLRAVLGFQPATN
jgi:DNA-directed RNA polymerase specialized sigma24 family protein